MAWQDREPKSETNFFSFLYTLYFFKMADVHDKATRSFNMSRIIGKNTKPEMLVRKYLFAHGFRYLLK